MSDGKNEKVISANSSLDLVLEGSVTPNNMSISYESGAPLARTFTIKLSEYLANNPSTQISAAIYESFDSINPLGAEYGTLTNAQQVAPGSIYFTVSYQPPATKPAKSKVIVKFTLSSEIETQAGAVPFEKTFTAIVKYVIYQDFQPFVFVEDAATVDFINGDYYCPTSNRGLAIFDTSLKVADTLDRNDDLSAGEISVNCAIRIGTAEHYGGLLVATGAGIVYYDSDPWAQPISFVNRRLISTKVMKSLMMAGDNVFMLDGTGKLYRIHYKKLLTKIEAGETLDALLATEDYQPFSFSEEDSNPYSVAAGATKLHYIETPMWLNDSSESAGDVDGQYYSGTTMCKGVAVVYKESGSNKKAMMSVVYAPIFNKVIVDGEDFDDSEPTLTKFYQFAYLDSDGDGPYVLQDASISDYPRVVLERDATLPQELQYASPVIYAPAMETASSRAVVLSVGDTPVTVSGNFDFMCPQNVDILAVLPYGDDSEVEIPEEEAVDTSYFMKYDNESYSVGDALRLGDYDDNISTNQWGYMFFLDSKLTAIKKELYPTMPADMYLYINTLKATVKYCSDAAGTTVIQTLPEKTLYNYSTSTTNWINPTPAGTLITTLPMLEGYTDYYVVVEFKAIHTYYIGNTAQTFPTDPDSAGGYYGTYTGKIVTPVAHAQSVLVDGDAPGPEPTESILYFSNTDNIYPPTVQSIFTHGSQLTAEPIGDMYFTEYRDEIMSRMNSVLAITDVVSIEKIYLTIYYYDLGMELISDEGPILWYDSATITSGDSVQPIKDVLPGTSGVDYYVAVKCLVEFTRTGDVPDSIEFYLKDGYDEYAYITK